MNYFDNVCRKVRGERRAGAPPIKREPAVEHRAPRRQQASVRFQTSSHSRYTHAPRSHTTTARERAATARQALSRCRSHLHRPAPKFGYFPRDDARPSTERLAGSVSRSASRNACTNLARSPAVKVADYSSIFRDHTGLHY